jgi:hypothetical protein
MTVNKKCVQLILYAHQPCQQDQTEIWIIVLAGRQGELHSPTRTTTELLRNNIVTIGQGKVNFYPSTNLRKFESDQNSKLHISGIIFEHMKSAFCLAETIHQLWR